MPGELIIFVIFISTLFLICVILNSCFKHLKSKSASEQNDNFGNDNLVWTSNSGLVNMGDGPKIDTNDSGTAACDSTYDAGTTTDTGTTCDAGTTCDTGTSCTDWQCLFCF